EGGAHPLNDVLVRRAQRRRRGVEQGFLHASALTTTGLLQGRRARGGLEPTIERRQVVLHVPELTSLRQDLREPLVEGARPSGVAHARGLVGAFEERRGAAREHAWSHLARLE